MLGTSHRLSSHNVEAHAEILGGDAPWRPMSEQSQQRLSLLCPLSTKWKVCAHLLILEAMLKLPATKGKPEIHEKRLRPIAALLN